ncbi:MAG: FxLYD domain-containing protein [Turicibacter sp.]|nr:FxLYD domain-containing protein [Turicibacter sp.]
MKALRAQIKTPEGTVLNVDVENYYLENSKIEIGAKDGKFYLTDLSNVLLTFEEVGGDDATAPSLPSQSIPVQTGNGAQETEGIVDHSAISDALVAAVGKLEWKFVDDGTGISATAAIENTTGKEISGVTIKVELWDDKDQAIETKTLYITDWEPGQKAELKFRTQNRFVSYSSWLESYLL